MGKRAGHVGVPLTLGDVSDRGFETLRLSIWGAWKIFGPDAGYAVCVNTIGVHAARDKVGHVPPGVVWRDATGDLPTFLRERLDGGMAEGVGWKLAPLRFFPDSHEISLDNDCVLWDLPPVLGRWLAAGPDHRCVMAEDVRACFGAFADLCGSEPRNAGIRGLPPRYELGAALLATLHDKEAASGRPLVLASELDEQGLQTAALSRRGRPLAVPLDDVTVCSPFWPHLPHLGRCGAHFVGLNARHIPWEYYGRPADEWMAEHWARHHPALCEQVAKVTGHQRATAVPPARCV